MDRIKFYLFLSLICKVLTCNLDAKAQAYLEPSVRFIANDKDSNSQNQYDNEVVQYLFPQEWSIGYFASPSFSGQYGIFLIRENDGPLLVYNRLKSNYSVSRRGRSEKKENIKVYSDTVRISKGEADRLIEIITDAIDKAVKPNGLGRLVFDGTTYFFMLPDRMAQTCSPEKNSNSYKLVEEFENLKKLFGDEPFLELSNNGPVDKIDIHYLQSRKELWLSVQDSPFLHKK